MTESVNELKKMLEESDEEKKVISPQKWSGFVESTVVNFLINIKLKNFRSKTEMVIERSFPELKITELKLNIILQS